MAVGPVPPVVETWVGVYVHNTAGKRRVENNVEGLPLPAFKTVGRVQAVEMRFVWGCGARCDAKRGEIGGGVRVSDLPVAARDCVLACDERGGTLSV